MTRDFSRGGTISLGAIKRVTTARSCERASTDRVPGTNPRADAMPRINDKQARNSRGIRSNYSPRTCSYRSRVLSDARETSQSCSRSGDRNLLVETPEGFVKLLLLLGILQGGPKINKKKLILLILS